MSTHYNGKRMNGDRGVFHEELVPLKGGPLDDPPMRRRSPTARERCTSMGTIIASFLALILCSFALVSTLRGRGSELVPDTVESSQEIENLKLYDELGRYVLEDYDGKPPFSDFLPGLAGLYGKPLYAFYVNRGQGIASFGFESKDYPIMEFNPANKAYQSTPLLGFRTFLQGSRKAKHFVVEPFSPTATRHSQLSVENRPKRYMYVGSNDMQIREVDNLNGIETNVTYFTLPEEDYGAFVKRTTITNLENNELTLALLDGLAKMEPAGGKLDKYLKNMGRTLEGWMGVYQPYSDTIKMPFFRLSMQPGDSASVVVQKAGHWCLSVLEGDAPDLLPIIVDTSKVFGDDTTLITPVNLFTKSIADIIHQPQYGFAKTASAFSALGKIKLGPGQSLTVSTFFGRADDILEVPVVARRLIQPGFVEYKLARTREVCKQISASVETKTADSLFDGHIQQVFLDNSLRGGIPLILGEVDDNAKMMSADEDGRLKVYHLFSRIHGDLERDYNNFVISPYFFSQGPGNFRDVAQNRRSDVIFNPRIGDFNVRMFLSFIQADGYEPMTVEAIVFTISDLKTCWQIAARAVGEADGHRAQREALTGILNSGPFRPGQLFHLIEQQNIELIISKQEFIDIVSAAADYSPMATYDTGFWADHFTYYMDLIDTYLAIYPEREAKLLFDTSLPYFFSPAFVKPRREKYVLSLTFDGQGMHVRQLDAVVEDDKEEQRYMQNFIRNDTGWYSIQSNWQRDANGKIFKSSPFAKLFLLSTLKFATRDAYGMGIEYEGGKPGWDDANNGLVGMVGSGMPETFELVVIIRYLLSAIQKHRRAIVIPLELNGLLQSISAALDTLTEDYVDPEELSARVPDALFTYWDAVSTARENYRMKTKTTFTGEEISLLPHTVELILQRWLDELELGIARALAFGTHGEGDSGKTGIPPTYFSYNVAQWTKTGKDNKDGHPLVEAKEMVVNKLPLFLEGPTRMMKVVKSSKAERMYWKVRGSPLRDQALKMYTISASLKGQSVDMGREMAFASGWLENQSVWLHISYKFYLEMLRNGLYKEFFEEMVGGMLPFMDAKVYGRSLMECSSFIASSAFEDPAVRGRGFLARLSGSTAEFLSMWTLMMIGPKPFSVDIKTGALTMKLLPALPRWLFDDKDKAIPTVSFKLFGAIDVTYYHLKGDEDLFGVPPSRYVIGFQDGSVFDISGPLIPFELADKIRRVVFVATIDAYFQ